MRTQRSAWAFAFGAWIGVRITLMPSVRRISSKGWLNFVSRSWIRNGVLSAELHDEVAGLLRHPAPVRIRGAGDVLDPSCRERDEEQDVDPLQEHGLDGEEITGQHARRLRPQEPSPRRRASLRRRPVTGCKQHLADGRRRDGDTDAF